MTAPDDLTPPHWGSEPPMDAPDLDRLHRTIAARDRRIARLVSALNDARAKGYVTQAEQEPTIVLSDDTRTPLADALAVPEVAALVEAVERLLPVARHYGGLTDEMCAAIMGAEATVRNFRKVSPAQHSLTTDAALRAIVEGKA